MRASVTRSRTGVLVAGAAAGALAAWVKAASEPRLQSVGERVFPPSPEQKSLLGADVTGRPERMPPAVMIRRLGRLATGRAIGDERSKQLMPFVHSAFGVGAGIVYFAAARRFPVVTTALGVPAGAALWLVTHGSSMPAAGLQASPTSMPRSWYVWELGSHLVFGATLELGRRFAVGVANRES